MDKIPLSEMLAQLRKELVQAQWEGEDSSLKFLIEDIEIELQIATTKEAGGGGGIKFWVFNADAKIDTSEAKTQKLKLKLKPVGTDGKPVNVGDEEDLGVELDSLATCERGREAGQRRRPGKSRG